MELVMTIVHLIEAAVKTKEVKVEVESHKIMEAKLMKQVSQIILISQI